MVDYESMTRPELIATIRVLEAKLSQAGPPSEAAGPDREFAALENERELLFDRNPQPMFIHDRETLQFLKVNDAALRFYGYSREEFLGMTRDEISTGNDVSKMSAIQRQREPMGYLHYRGSHQHRKKSGESAEVELFAQDILYHRRNARVTLLVDDTERKRAEEALRASEEQYRALFETMDEGFCVIEMLYDPNGKAADYRFAEINPAFEKHTGLQQALGKTIRQMVPDLDANWFEIYGKVARTGEAIRFENPAIAMQRYYDVFAFRIGGDGSQQVGVLFNDITERKRAEVALRRSEQRLNRLISMSPAAIFSVSLEPPFGVTFIGDNVTEQTGWLPSDFTGDPSFWLNHVHPEDQARVGEIVSRLVTDGKYAYDYRFRHKDGSWRWMREEAHVVHAGDGAPCEAIGICMDITTEHREAEKRKERGLRRRDALVREVHHRIKNSLQGVVGLLRQFAGDYPDVSPLMDKAVAQMQAVAVAHGLQARALRGGILLREIVPAIAEATEQMIRVPLCVEIAAEVNAQLLLPENEAVPIALVLNELMLNAAKCAAAQPQPDAVRVTLSVTSEGTRVAVSNPGRLPPGFDFPRGRGVGTGLKLVRSLLPQEGVTLVYSQSGGRVHAAVELSAPAIAITPQVELRVAEV